MKYFTDGLGGVFAYEEDGSQDAYIAPGLTPLSEEDLAEIRAAQALALEPSHEQLLADASAKRDSLLAMAGLRIAPLQDKVDLSKAPPEDIESLIAWKQYRIDVNGVDDQEGYPGTIEWPDSPQP